MSSDNVPSRYDVVPPFNMQRPYLWMIHNIRINRKKIMFHNDNLDVYQRISMYSWRIKLGHYWFRIFQFKYALFIVVTRPNMQYITTRMLTVHVLLCYVCGLVIVDLHIFFRVPSRACLPRFSGATINSMGKHIGEGHNIIEPKAYTVKPCASYMG